jgi:hypothetical protein
MYKYILIIPVLLYLAPLRAEEVLDQTILWNTPGWITERFENSDLNNKYKLSSKINPFYLRGDFNGDGEQDIAILIEEIKTKKIGIGVFHSNSNKTNIIGAGNIVGHGGDNFEWMDMWSIYKKQPIEQGGAEGKPPTINSEALDVGKSESASAIIYWDGKDYLWYQQGN